MKAARNAALPSDPGQRARAGHRERAAGRPGARGRGPARRAPRCVQSHPCGRQSARHERRRIRPAGHGERARCEASLAQVRTRPTEKQVAFYQRLAESPVFTEEERRRALEWLATKATRQTIKDQIDWLKRQVETRRAGRGQSAAA